MKSKLFPLLALVLCMGALFMPVTAYAATDTTPPTLDAWLEGDILHAETRDRGTGVEAVYIDGHRIGYLVDGTVEVGLSGYSGDGEYITVYAVDYAGNKSSEVTLKNPRYTPPAETPAPSGTTPAPTPSQPAQTQPPASTSRPGGSSSQPPASSASEPPVSSEPPASSTPEGDEGSETAIPEEGAPNPFTPDGTGSVQDNATELDGKEFFTITTEDGNVFYLVIDRQRDSEGVYLLNAVTEDDLLALAEKGGTSGESAIPVPDPTPEPTPQPQPDSTPEPEPEASGDGGMGTFIFIVLAVAAVGGAGYYFKILKPKRDAAASIDEEDEDEDDVDEGYLDEDDYDEWDSKDTTDPSEDDDSEYEFERDDEDGGTE